MKHLILAAALMTLTMPALAQDSPALIEQQKCWLGSISFSPGATAKAGNAVLLCSDDFRWVETDQWAAGCYHDGKLYSPDAIPNASQQQQVLTRCDPDGTWAIYQPENR